MKGNLGEKSKCFKILWKWFWALFCVTRIYLQIKYLCISYFLSLIDIVQLELYVWSFKCPSNIYLLNSTIFRVLSCIFWYFSLLSKSLTRKVNSESAGPLNLIWRWTIFIRWKIFWKKLDDVVSNFDGFIMY